METRQRYTILIGVLVITLLVSGCTDMMDSAYQLPVADTQVENGSPERGRRLIMNYGCGACHAVDGVPGANGAVGPPLYDLNERAYIAGSLLNSVENLMTWIQDPHSIEPGTAMPDLGVPADDARDIVAFLYNQPEVWLTVRNE